MGIYEQRPWTSLYDAGLPHDLEPGYDNALDMFRAGVRRAGGRPAIHYFTSTLTWSDVDRLTDGLACGLRELGVGRGDRVAAYLQNVPQFVLTMVATWKVGGAMVSINPMYRHNELRTLLVDSGCKVLVVLESLYESVASEVVPSTEVSAVITTSELDFLDGGRPALLSGIERRRPQGTHDLLELAHRHAGSVPDPVDLAPGDVALLTYTSGTTGPPKGAMNTHAGVVFVSQAYGRWMHLTEDDVVLGAAPLFHVTGLFAHITVSMLLSTPLVLSYRFEPAVTLELIEHHRATFTIASITAFISLMNHPSIGDHDLTSLERAYSGGQPVAPALVDAFEAQVGVYIHNVYGLTEATGPTHATPLHARAPADQHSGALSVGVPIFNTIVRILGADGRELAPGEVGELEIRGPQIMAGYWGKPDESARVLPGGALRTGDVGFMDEDGWFYLVDRKKDLIVASGYKVWPREVEDVLYGHPAVREAAVIGVPDAYRGETVKAFVSLKENATAQEPEIIAFCRERIAAYKYPRSVVILAELPKNASGKILRRELRTFTTGGEG